MLQIWGITDIGLVRKENQDAYAVYQERECTICVVCDGMGGPAGGKLASQIAVDTFTSELKKILRADMTAEQIKEASAYAVSMANRAIRKTAEDLPEYCSMGTTLVSAVTQAATVGFLTHCTTAGTPAFVVVVTCLFLS